MLDPKTLKKDIDLIVKNLDKKKFHLDKDLFLNLDSNRKDIIAETENLQSKKNILSKEIGFLKSKGEGVENLTSEVPPKIDILTPISLTCVKTFSLKLSKTFSYAFAFSHVLIICKFEASISTKHCINKPCLKKSNATVSNFCLTESLANSF